jgi:hypothetical protein
MSLPSQKNPTPLTKLLVVGKTVTKNSLKDYYIPMHLIIKSHYLFLGTPKTNIFLSCLCVSW